MITALEEEKGGRRKLEGENVIFWKAIEEMGPIDIVTG